MELSVGFKFNVIGKDITGEILSIGSVCGYAICCVDFKRNNEHYISDCFIDTIINNLKYGLYEEATNA